MFELSLILVNNNTSTTLKCLKNIQENKFPKTKYEVLLVDNTNIKSDISKLEAYLKTEKNYQVITNSKQGIGVARNKGIEKSQGKIILFLNPNLSFKKNFLEEHYKFHTKYKNKNIICQGYIDYPENSKLELWLKNKSYLYEELINSYYNYSHIVDPNDLYPLYGSLNNISFKKELYKYKKINPWLDLSNGENPDFILGLQNKTKIKIQLSSETEAKYLSKITVEELQKILKKQGENYKYLQKKYPNLHPKINYFTKFIGQNLQNKFFFKLGLFINKILTPKSQKINFYIITLKYFFLGLNQNNPIK